MLFKKIIFRLLHKKNVDEVSLHEKRLDAAIKCDKTHREYLHVQLHRTLSKKNVGTSNRYIYLIDRLREKVDISNLEVLCVGCRSVGEINYFKSIDAKRVVGIDLFFESEEIMVMDMHEMTFEDNSFDVIFSSHSLEHARDYKKAVSEFVRVAKNGSIFVIEVPVNYETTSADLWDFESLKNLKNMFKKHINQILFEELEKKRENSSYGTDVIRMIFTISKAPVEGKKTIGKTQFTKGL
jgi:SAM-dependent methyltransferase